MKKLILFILMLVSFPIMFNAEDYNYVPEGLEDSFKAEGISYDLGNYKPSDEKVNVYLFRGQGCGHCQHFLQFVSDTLVKEYGDYFNFIAYETWKNSDNNHLMEEVKSSFGVESRGVPFIVIDDKFFSGYGDSRSEAIINLIKSEYENKDRVDVVKKIAYGNESLSYSDILPNSEDNKNDDEIKDNNDNKSNNNSSDVTSRSEDSNESNMEIFIIIGVILVSIAALVYVVLTYRKLKRGK